MTYKIIIQPEAIDDLYAIKSYITRSDSVKKANKFMSELKQSIKSLGTMPMRCRKSYYTDDENSHDLIYKKYTIVFKIIKDTVYVVSVFKQREY
jgi:plasmid stabilization system protein ParE